MSVDCARVLTSKLNDVMRPAGRIIGVQMRKRFPTAAETWDFDIVLAATIRGALDNGIEPRDITATGKQTDALYSHDCPFSSPNGQADAAALAIKLMNSRRLTACHDTQARVPAQLAHLKGGEPVNVRFGSKSRHVQCKTECPLWVNSGHMQRTRSCLLWARSGHSRSQDAGYPGVPLPPV